jgi:hypothetical protein
MDNIQYVTFAYAAARLVVSHWICRHGAFTMKAPVKVKTTLLIGAE